MMAPLELPIALEEELNALQQDICEALKLDVEAIDVITKDELRKVLQVRFSDQSLASVHMVTGGVPTSSLQSEVATLDYLSTHTSLPVPRILYTNYAKTEVLKPYIVLEKAKGVSLESVWDSLATFEQHLIVGQVARWMMEVFAQRFDKIGSLFPIPDQPDPGKVVVGSIISPLFYINSRSTYPLDRGPWSSAKAYLTGCAQRELDCSRFIMNNQDTSTVYQQKVEEERFNVERSMSLFQRLIDRCDGLDELDSDMAPFSLDIHDISLKSLTVDPDDATKVTAVDLHALTTQPLWSCARVPSWISPSIADSQAEDKSHLAKVFRQTVISVEGYHSLFLRGIDTEDTRHVLDDVSRYDALKDSFLLTPTLESIAATLPGEEDVEGLEALLDPSTLEGRVARISLMTRGPGVMELAMPLELSKDTATVPLDGDAPTEHNAIFLPKHLSEVRGAQQRAVSASASVSRKASNEGLLGSDGYVSGHRLHATAAVEFH